MAKLQKEAWAATQPCRRWKAGRLAAFPSTQKGFVSFDGFVTKNRQL